jgi:hypothetical protein
MTAFDANKGGLRATSPLTLATVTDGAGHGTAPAMAAGNRFTPAHPSRVNATWWPCTAGKTVHGQGRDFSDFVQSATRAQACKREGFSPFFPMPSSQIGRTFFLQPAVNRQVNGPPLAATARVFPVGAWDWPPAAGTFRTFPRTRGWSWPAEISLRPAGFVSRLAPPGARNLSKGSSQ